MLQTIEIETGPTPRGAVIWLHGLGADGNDFAPIVGELKLPAGLDLRFVLPHAPVQPVTINGGMAMRSWYDILALEGNARVDTEGLQQSVDALRVLIECEQQRGIAAANIVLAGFSQGGAVALRTATTHTETLAGVLALSTYLPLADHLPDEASEAGKSVGIFMAHGIYDPVVPVAMGSDACKRLREQNFTVDWHEYPMQHAVCLEEIADISAWLQNVYAV